MLSIFFKFFKRFFLVVIISILLATYHQFIIKKVKSQLRFFGLTEIDKYEVDFAKEKLFRDKELAAYDGKDLDGKIFISILGSVYDVTRGRKHYGEGGTYNFFAGKDASIAFVTGEFESYTPQSSDVLQLTPAEVYDISKWRDFYAKEYKYVGKLIGRFYDEVGEKTKYHLQVENIVQQAVEEKKKKDDLENEFPPCNIEWQATFGTKVWCSESSGGVNRGWIGVPRKFFKAGGTSYRCACIQEHQHHSPHIKEYDNCDPKSDTCFYKVD